jgi:hypothetical protein
MNRRKFIQKTIGSVLLLAMVIWPIQGCTDTTENILNTVINSSLAVIKVADPNASWLPEFASAVAALEQAETDWKGGSPIAVVESALATLEAVTAQIPLTAVYSPLIDVLVAGIDAVLATLPSTAAPVANARTIALTANPHRGRVVLNQPKHVGKLSIQSHVAAYKAQWNDIAKSNVKLVPAEI